VDDTQFVGSLNIADPYTGVRYGCGSFRDMNCVVEGLDAKGARDFFRDMLLRNVRHHPGILSEVSIKSDFDGFDKVFADKESPHYRFNVEEPPKKLEISQSVTKMISEAKTSIRIVQPYVQNI
jgi:phosphatidylserine/phosphatidylglycerophosphate/cardiolipin synthase-like enzyme